MTRAHDIGSQYPSDAADSAPDDPTDGYSETDYSIPVPTEQGSGYIDDPLIGRNAYNREIAEATISDVSGKINIRETIIYDPYTNLEARFSDILRIVTGGYLAFDLDDGRFVQTTDYADEVLYLYKPIIAMVTVNNADGTYDWEKVNGDGEASGTARELNGSTVIVAGTVVELQWIEDEYVFFFPVQECEYIE